MKVKIAVPPWIAADLEPFVGTKVRLGRVTIANRAPEYRTSSTIELVVSDKAVAHPPAASQRRNGRDGR